VVVDAMSRILGVDPGEARIGLAVSDTTRTIARPLEVVRHTARDEDASRILEIARREGAELIVVGVAYDSEGRTGPAARRGLRLAEALRQQGSHVAVIDESDSTRLAIDRHGVDALTDARAAAFILQAYLDAAKTA
jgi:putative Holliday junction resolvase